MCELTLLSKSDLRKHKQNKHSKERNGKKTGAPVKYKSTNITNHIFLTIDLRYSVPCGLNLRESIFSVMKQQKVYKKANTAQVVSNVLKENFSVCAVKEEIMLLLGEGKLSMVRHL